MKTSKIFAVAVLSLAAAAGVHAEEYQGVQEPVSALSRADVQAQAVAAANAKDQMRVEPIYETCEGWSESTHGARSWADLPAAAIKYIRRIEELIGASVSVLSTSPERDDTILVQNPFEG